MANSNLAIVTNTFYSLNSNEGKVRSEIAKRTIESSVKKGYPIFVVDGGSDKRFVDEIMDLGAYVSAQEEKGMGNSKRQAIRQAYEHPDDYKAFLWIEPEKNFAGQGLIERVAYPLLSGKADVVVPVRTKKSLKSMPPVQMFTETAGDRFFEDLSRGLKLDLWFGPRVWRRGITKKILEYRNSREDNYSPLYVPAVLQPIAEGKKVIPVPVDFIYPKSQVELESRSLEYHEKRFSQLRDVSAFLKEEWEKLSH